MIRSGARRLLAMAALLPVLVAFVLPAVASISVCRYGLQMDAETCCPKHQTQSPDRGASVQDAPCCSVRALAFDRFVSDRSTRVEGVRVWTLPLAISYRPVAWSTQRTAVTRIESPPPIGPPVRLSKQSFLL